MVRRPTRRSCRRYSLIRSVSPVTSSDQHLKFDYSRGLDHGVHPLLPVNQMQFAIRGLAEMNLDSRRPFALKHLHSERIDALAAQDELIVKVPGLDD